jgi:2-(1,2-epoxy-1,2-dihydrophenyl)acetyl-CoA isomerase
MSGVLIEALEDGLLTLTLNRPERRNALDTAMLESLVDATRRAATNPAVSALMLTGAGGAFCVGGDVKAMAARGNETTLTDERIADLRGKMEAARLLHEMRKPTIAAIEGAAAGAGLSLALACDLRIANRSAKLTTAFAKVALSGDFGGTYFLTKLLGSAKARELYLTSPILSADDQAQSQSCRTCAARDVLRQRGDQSRACRGDRGSPGSGRSLCREAPARLQRTLT